MSQLTDIARETSERLSLLPDGAPVLVMLSGGGDSVALLHLLARGTFGEHATRALHVNHGLRGAESEGDEAFVRELCERMAVDCRVVRFDVAAYARDAGLNLEDAGRQVRYRFAADELDAICDALGVRRATGAIAVAHTRDDRIETFLMRAAHGAGSGGLSSIAARRGRVVRPLIECDRAEVRSWLESIGAAWREDSSNADTTRERAYVRAEVVPALERLNPAFRANISRSLDLVAADDALLSAMADSFALQFTVTEPGARIAFDREMMATLDPVMARRTVRAALAAAFPEVTRIDAAHIASLVEGLSSDAFARDLPGGLCARTEYASMVVSWRDEEPLRVAPRLLSVPGSADLGSAGSISAEDDVPKAWDGGSESVVIDADSVTGELTIGSMQEGERMRPLGMTGTRKLSDMLTDAKVPRRLRHATPVVRDGDRVVWLAGVRMSDEYRVDASTRRAIRLTWEREGSAACSADEPSEMGDT